MCTYRNVWCLANLYLSAFGKTAMEIVINDFDLGNALFTPICTLAMSLVNERNTVKLF